MQSNEPHGDVHGHMRCQSLLLTFHIPESAALIRSVINPRWGYPWVIWMYFQSFMPCRGTHNQLWCLPQHWSLYNHLYSDSLVNTFTKYTPSDETTLCMHEVELCWGCGIEIGMTLLHAQFQLCFGILPHIVECSAWPMRNTPQLDWGLGSMVEGKWVKPHCVALYKVWFLMSRSQSTYCSAHNSATPSTWWIWQLSRMRMLLGAE